MFFVGIDIAKRSGIVKKCAVEKFPKYDKH